MYARLSGPVDTTFKSLILLIFIHCGWIFSVQVHREVLTPLKFIQEHRCHAYIIIQANVTGEYTVLWQFIYSG